MLSPGDIIVLDAGTYPLLNLTNLHGSPTAWITITGPDSGSPATIIGETCCNAVEIKNCTYVAIKNLTVDSRGLAGVTGISAKDGMTNLTHDILLRWKHVDWARGFTANRCDFDENTYLGMDDSAEQGLWGGHRHVLG